MTALSYTFPTDFIWGAATAAHQIEGNNVSSDWWAREHSPNTDLSEASNDACDSYNRFEEDIRLLAASGLRMYRFSIEWARIEPECGCFSKAQLLHYRRMIDTCRQYGVEPMVTLYHMTLPLWFAEQGGWRRADAVERFRRYIEYVLPILHDVTWVCTLNEPNMVALTRGGTEGSDFIAASLPYPDPEISENLVAAHRSAREVLSSVPSIKSGWTIACQAFHAVPGCEAEMEAYQYPREDYFTEAAAGDDFIGVQAYLRTFIGKDGPVPTDPNAERTLTGWEYFPPALGIAVRHTWEVGGHTPIFVTENGIATANDARRIDYTYDALAGLHDAMADGIDVRGYLHWSLLDNYEWGSFRPTFGLIGWDKDTFERHPRPSLEWLGGIACGASGKATSFPALTAADDTGPPVPSCPHLPPRQPIPRVIRGRETEASCFHAEEAGRFACRDAVGVLGRQFEVASRRARATAYRLMPAATEALSDSTMSEIGMPATASQASRTRRLTPLPSEPKTTISGSVSKPVSPTSASPPPSSATA